MDLPAKPYSNISMLSGMDSSFQEEDLNLQEYEEVSCLHHTTHRARNGRNPSWPYCQRNITSLVIVIETQALDAQVSATGAPAAASPATGATAAADVARAKARERIRVTHGRQLSAAKAVLAGDAKLAVAS